MTTVLMAAVNGGPLDKLAGKDGQAGCPIPGIGRPGSQHEAAPPPGLLPYPREAAGRLGHTHHNPSHEAGHHHRSLGVQILESRGV